VHIPSDRLSISTPTTEDFRAIDAFVDVGVDMIALSFVRSAHDVRRIGTEIYPRGPLVIAKIETRAAVQNLAGIIEAAGAIMVARGDLGNECTIEELPYLQKQIIRDCIAGGRPVITATQMLESMIESAAPTRAEASDVANAVWDGSSAVMLSAETAIGVDPVNVVRTMHRIVRRADESFDYGGWAANLAKLRMTKSDTTEHSVTDAMTMAAWRAATELGLSTIVCISGSGFTVRSVARFRPTARILGFSHNPRTVKQLTLSWGTTSIQLDAGGTNDEMVRRALLLARDAGYVRAGELVAVLAGMSTAARSTNVLRVETVP
jgi:pyruvate kinase